MSYKPVKVFNVGIASGASTSSAIDLGTGYSKLAITYVTMSTGSPVGVWGCDTLTGTYLPMTALVPSTATVAFQTLLIPTSTSGSWAVFEAPPHQYIQLITTSGVVSGGASFTVIGRD